MRIKRGVTLLCCLFLLAACRAQTQTKEYGVFVGSDPSLIEKLSEYDSVVIDAQYYSQEEIARLHAAGTRVYSYLNVGSIESFRTYYKAFEDIILSPYENWDDEFWVDVSSPKWQQLVREQANEYAKKGVDGFFLDNADVYYHYREKRIFDALSGIIQDLGGLEKEVLINGGDAFVQEAIRSKDESLAAITGVNQECVFTNIDFDNGRFVMQDKETSEYYKEYLLLCSRSGLSVYLTEYLSSEDEDAQSLTEAIEAYCSQNGFRYFIASSLNLDE